MKYVIHCALILSSTITFAGQETQEDRPVLTIPGLQYESLSENFDGSLTVKGPRLLYADEYVFVAPESGLGFCRWLNMEFGAVELEFVRTEKVLELSDQGKVKNIIKPMGATAQILSLVTCYEIEFEDGAGG